VRVGRQDLCAALARLTPEEAAEALKYRYLPIAWQPGLALYVAGDAAAGHEAARRGLPVIAEVPPGEFAAALERAYGRAIVEEASWGLAQTSPHLSAVRRLTPTQAMGLAAMLVMLAMAGLVDPGAAGLALSLLCALFFLAVIGLRVMSLVAPGRKNAIRPARLGPDDLPVYTVLVPLYRETNIVRQLIAGLEAIRYPRHKLDIKLILEESDIYMRRAVARLDLKAPFEVLTVPCLGPQTKPKALNYGLAFARGDLVTIYDAEDIPEPRQLLHAAALFAAAPPEVACLQASLAFYNPGENWLTRQFAAEYAMLFDLLLPVLAGLGMPLPLGGTSNHFRRRALERIGGWDPHNVTEDADLGIRLARLGYEAATFGSTTNEEANCDLANWLSQRARWLKGWLQTWLVHMRRPVVLWQEVGAAGFVVIQTLMLGTLVSALAHPLFLGWTVWRLASGRFFPPLTDTVSFVMTALALAVLVAGYAVTMLAGLVALECRGLGRLWPAVLTMPVYWLVLSLGGWLAVWQFICAPFHWNKTRHGLTRHGPTGIGRRDVGAGHC